MQRARTNSLAPPGLSLRSWATKDRIYTRDSQAFPQQGTPRPFCQEITSKGNTGRTGRPRSPKTRSHIQQKHFQKKKKTLTQADAEATEWYEVGAAATRHYTKNVCQWRGKKKKEQQDQNSCCFILAEINWPTFVVRVVVRTVPTKLTFPPITWCWCKARWKRLFGHLTKSLNSLTLVLGPLMDSPITV